MGSRQDYNRFVKMARGSAAELETELMLADRLGFSEAEAIADAMEELTVVRRLMQALINALGKPPYAVAHCLLPIPHCPRWSEVRHAV